jgi:hypothetical protein
MQMIRQDHGRFNRKGMSRSHPAKRDPEKADLLGQNPSRRSARLTVKK